MRRLIPLLAAIAALPGVAAPPSSGVAFRCAIGPKRVEVAREAGRYVYRYGLPGRPPEMEIASSGHDGRLYLYQDSFAGGGGAELRFVHGDTSYLVYSLTGRGGNAAGLIVVRGVRKLYARDCADRNADMEVDFDAIDKDAESMFLAVE